MKFKLNPIFILLSILVITSLSCSSFMNFGKKSTSPEPTGNKTSSNKLLGEEFRSESGGFSIYKVKGYNFEEVIGIVNMTAPDADSEHGPGIMAMGGLNETETTNEALLEKTSQDSSTFTLSKPKKVKIGGVQGLLVEIGGNYNDVEMKGRMVVAMVTPLQQFTLLGIAPADRWNELLPIFNAVAETTTFFEPKPEPTEEAMPTDDPFMEEPTDEPFLEEPTDEALMEEPTAAATQESSSSGPQLIRQWAVSAKASSEFSNPNWGAEQATGAPDVDDCGDNVQAWAPYDDNTVEWIELTYAVPVIPSEITIFQTFNPSQVVKVELIDTDGGMRSLWSGRPEIIDACPDWLILSVQAKDKKMINKIRITVDQSVLGLGWNEIDAVELVGTTSGQAQQNNASPTSAAPKVSSDSPAPTNYTGWMAGPVYQGYLKIIPGKTRVNELNGLLGSEGQRSTDSWKPRPNHADTFIFKLGRDNMMVWISVTTDGIVYKKAISDNTYPSDFQLATVNKDTYAQLDAIYKRDQAIPYTVMANLLKSPGFLKEQTLREDGRMEDAYSWYNAAGDRMIGFFYDGMLTGIAGLVYLAKP